MAACLCPLCLWSLYSPGQGHLHFGCYPKTLKQSATVQETVQETSITRLSTMQATNNWVCRRSRHQLPKCVTKETLFGNNSCRGKQRAGVGSDTPRPRFPDSGPAPPSSPRVTHGVKVLEGRGFVCYRTQVSNGSFIHEFNFKKIIYQI